MPIAKKAAQETTPDPEKGDSRAAKNKKAAPNKKTAPASVTRSQTDALKPKAKRVAPKSSSSKISKAASPAPASDRETAADAVDDQLARYRSMRDFSVTAEPSGKAKDGTVAALPFCIQKHAASHLHYDFRLGWNGVLKSWACARGPSYLVADKRLAVQVEDHPMEYGGFEGIIPAGQYGGGTVMLWDQGTWEPQAGHTDVDAGLRDGQLKFIMHGTKMHGKWALIRMGGKAAQERKPNWLLIKEHDDFERAPTDPAVTDAESTSVVTGRSLEEIAANQDHIWNSKETATGNAWYRSASHSPDQIDPPGPAKAKAKPSAQKSSTALDPLIQDLPKEAQPSFLKPQLALETTSPPAGPAWIHELKLDGYRMQARKDGSSVQMLTRSGIDWTDRVRSVAAEVARLPIAKVTLDGEVVVLAENGTTNFADLQASFQEGARNPLTFFCFDLLHLSGRNPRDLPLVERKRLLTEILRDADPSALQVSEHLNDNGEEMFHKACELHAEGIVSKKAAGRYTPTRGGDWLKSKCLHVQEFVIGGYTLPSNGSSGIGALLLGFYTDDGKLIYAGRTGTGFTQKTSRALRLQLEPTEQPEPPFQRPSTEARRGARWVCPELVAQVRFATWTADEQVRQAAFLGLREDKAAAEVRREGPEVAPRPKGSPRPAAPLPPSPSRPPAAHKSTSTAAPVRLTHPEKILDPTSHLTKQQLADFYWAVSARMLPHIAGRALSNVRQPEGIGKPSFYQKHVTATLPAGFESVDVPDKKTGSIEKYIALHTREAIASLAQMSVLEIHPWGSRADDLERADRLVIDLDPDESLSWPVLTGAAADVRKSLSDLGLESFLKTTGGKGLHVAVPIEPDMDWPQIKEFCHGFVLLLEKANPRLYLTKMTKSARAGKIYLDYLRNERGATAVAPYSPRARPEVGVAVPLEWKELKLPERPLFRVGNFAEWSPRLKEDPWAKMPQVKQKITAEARRMVGMR